MSDGEEVINTFRPSGKAIWKTAAGNTLAKPGQLLEKANDIRVAFQEGTTKNKVTVLSGVLTGVTMTLDGVRNIKRGLTRNADGARDVGTAAVGVCEVAGGLFTTTLFYERLKIGDGGEIEVDARGRG